MYVNIDVSGCVEGSGNTIPNPTKKINAAKRWCFTLNNYTDNDRSVIETVIENLCVFGVYGKEVGEEGTPHLQGYIEFKKRGRPIGIFGIKRIHWEIAGGNRRQNIVYCTKYDTNPYFYPPKHVKKAITFETFYEWENTIIENLKHEPDDRKIYWYWSEEGGVGKTSFQKWIYRNYKYVIILSGKAHDCKNALVDYVRTHGRGPSICLINVPKAVARKDIDYETFESIKDMFFYCGKYEGGMVDEDPCHLLVFANCEPDESKMTERFEIINL